MKTRLLSMAAVIVVLNLSAQTNPSVPPPPTIWQPAGETNTDLTLAWDPSPDGGIAGYNLYRGTNSHVYVETNWTWTNLQWTVTNISTIRGVTNFFAATAVGTNHLESDFSNEISWTTAKPAPPTLRSKIVVTPVFQASANMLDWKDVGTGPEVVFDAPEAWTDGGFVRVKLKYRRVYATTP